MDGNSFAGFPRAEASPWQRRVVNGGIEEEDAWQFRSTESTKNAGQKAITTDAMPDFGHQHIRANTSGQVSEHSNRKDKIGGRNNSEQNAESKMELAQQLLDHLLGQYFKKSDTFGSLVAAASNAQAPANIVCSILKIVAAALSSKHASTQLNAHCSKFELAFYVDVSVC